MTDNELVFDGIDADKIDQTTLRILQDALQSSWQDLDYRMHDLKEVLHAVRSQIYLRRQEYAGTAKQLSEQYGFEIRKRDAEQYGMIVEEMRLYHPDRDLLVTADYSAGELTGVVALWQHHPDREGFEAFELLKAATHKDRVKLAEQCLADVVEFLQEGDTDGA